MKPAQNRRRGARAGRSLQTTEETGFFIPRSAEQTRDLADKVVSRRNGGPDLGLNRCSPSSLSTTFRKSRFSEFSFQL